jgi:hypothetical protein
MIENYIPVVVSGTLLDLIPTVHRGFESSYTTLPIIEDVHNEKEVEVLNPFGTYKC